MLARFRVKRSLSVRSVPVICGYHTAPSRVKNEIPFMCGLGAPGSSAKFIKQKPEEAVSASLCGSGVCLSFFSQETQVVGWSIDRLEEMLMSKRSLGFTLFMAPS